MSQYFGLWGTATPFAWSMITILLVWSFIWKGIALWKAARRNDLYWFLAILIINTVGILEILYIFIWNKRPQKKQRFEDV